MSVYRNARLGDSTAKGATAIYDAFVLIGPGIDGAFETIEGRPELELRERMGRPIAVPAMPMYHGEPVDASKMAGPMFGGNFVYSSDSRFARLNDGRPIPVHDRYETWEDYDRLSR